MGDGGVTAVVVVVVRTAVAHRPGQEHGRVDSEDGRPRRQGGQRPGEHPAPGASVRQQVLPREHRRGQRVRVQARQEGIGRRERRHAQQ